MNLMKKTLIGWRGASRYYSDAQRSFWLECRAIKKNTEWNGIEK
jgi:hypothetical protein